MSEKISYAEGTYIYSQGDVKMCMYRVLEGNVSLTVCKDNGEKLELTVLSQGDFFGQTELVEGLPRTTGALALSDCTVEMISSSEFGRYFSENPDQYLKIISQMCAFVRVLDSKYEAACVSMDALLRTDGDEKKGLLSKIKAYLSLGGRR